MGSLNTLNRGRGVQTITGGARVVYFWEVSILSIEAGVFRPTEVIADNPNSKVSILSIEAGMFRLCALALRYALALRFNPLNRGRGIQTHSSSHQHTDAGEVSILSIEAGVFRLISKLCK